MKIRGKNTYRPTFKQLIRLRENIQNRKKLLNFKKKKWSVLIKQYERRLKWLNKRYKPRDQVQLGVSKYSSKGKAYDRQFRDALIAKKRFDAFYGGIGKRYLKKQITYAFKKNKKNYNLFLEFLKTFERRLDTVLYRSKFVLSIRAARMLISHRKIYVNNQVVNKSSYLLKQGDFIKINKNLSLLIRENIKLIDVYPLPPKYLFINYKTMQILFGDIKNINFATSFNSNLELEKILLNYK